MAQDERGMSHPSRDRWIPLLARTAFAPLLLTYAALKIRTLSGSVTADMLQNFTLTQFVVYLTVAIELSVACCWCWVSAPGSPRACSRASS